MDITGKLIQVLDPVTGEGKNGTWKKQEFIIETFDEYPKKVCISNWGDKLDINSLSPNDKIKVYVNLESREYNGRWYTEVRAWKMEKEESTAPPMQDAPPPGEAPDFSNDEMDDLPF
jgi:Domain of unknown function (DUF3127)